MPFLRVIAPLIAGISLALWFPAKAMLLFGITIAIFLCLLVWNLYQNKKQSFSTRWVFGALTALLLIATGYSLTLLKRPYQQHSYYEKFLDNKSDSLVITVLSEPQEKEKTIKVVAEINGISIDGKSHATTGKALFYFEKDSVANTIKYGDILLVHAYLEGIKRPGNPDEFDYRNYLALHDIYREAYVRAGDYSFTGKSHANWLLSFTNSCRQKLIVLLNNRIGGNEASVASAILLGYRDDLSQSVIQQFADSGTIHVICVAGLHVGILFWLLGLLLLPLEKLKHGKLMRTILLLLLLWLYALFTGMATPVLRATVMFSFLLVGRHFGKYTNSINTLAASAFLTLLVNPFALADTGFQLSYLSVLGIIVIYPMLNQWLTTRYFLLEKIWELACLSIAAQIAIAPLSILYFHQFPNYFVFTNLLIVPLLSLVLYAGLLFFITAHIPVLSTITGWVLQKSLWLMNGLVTHAPHLPYFVSKGLSISIPEALLLYVVLLALLAYVVNKMYNALLTSLCCLTLFLGIRVYKEYHNLHQQLFIVYDTPKHSTVAFLSGKQCITTQPVDSLDLHYHIQYHWWDKGIGDTVSLKSDSIVTPNLFIQGHCVQFNKLKVAFIDNKKELPSSKLTVNYLVLSGSYRADLASLQNAFIFDILIFDSSVSPYRLKKWKDECEQLHIPYYDVNQQGAFIENCAL